MIVKCIRPYRTQVSEKHIYLVIEVFANVYSKKYSFRIIDNDGCPAIYNADLFEIVSSKIINSSIIIDANSLVVSHDLIVNTSLNQKHMEGFWGCYFDGIQEAKCLLETVVEDISKCENIVKPQIVFFENEVNENPT